MTSEAQNQIQAGRSHWLHWPIVIVFGVLPNLVLLTLAGMIALVSFNSSVLYAASSNPVEFLFCALLLGAPAVGNLLKFVVRRWREKHWLTSVLVVANAGLILYSLNGWKESFEIYSTFSPPAGTVLGVIGLSSLAALTWNHLSRSERLTFSLRQLFAVVTGISVFLTVAGWIVRPDMSWRYDAQSPIASHFMSLGATVRWDDWSVTGIQARAQPVTDQDLSRLPELLQLQSLELSDTQVTDRGADSIQSVRWLEHLYLDDTSISDVGMAKMAGLTRLQNLWLTYTRVTDTGLRSLARMNELSYLELGGTAVTDSGLEHLRHLHRLNYLGLSRTKVTKAGIDRLHKALPQCHIYGTPNGKDYSVGR